MRKNLLILASGIVLLFSGCSKKMPVAIPGSGGSAGGFVDNGPSVPDYGSTSNSTTGSVGRGVDSSSVNNSANSNAVSKHKKNSFEKGAVNSSGKYTGSDGVSKSGIKLLYFASDSYTLDDDQIQRLMSDIPKIKRMTSSGKVIVEGNCDEFGTDEYNHALGLKRARAVKKLLISAGINENKIDTVSYGESNPVCTIEAPACHAKNRRAEINRI
jgi:peptidoglycan-associated lipoprotein